ncbi:MAG: hypothetical protein JSW07_13545 [bacterium]|nr:MAG: hypothetical protein JSW07_13545 [bacterium]
MFEMIQTITIDLDKSMAFGTAKIPADNPIFADHFPDFPLLPGTMAVELTAQVAGTLSEKRFKQQYNLERWAILGMIRNAKFHLPVNLPATLQLTAKLNRLDLSSAVLLVTAHKDNQLVLKGEIVMMMMEDSPDLMNAIKARQERLIRWRII